MKLMMFVAVGASAVLMCACASESEKVRAMASSEIVCNAAQVTVTKTQQGGYIRDDRYEAQGCGQRVSYLCGQVHVLLIPTGVAICHKE